MSGFGNYGAPSRWELKKQARAAEKVANRAQKKAVIKALSERDQLFRLWKQWRRDVVNEELDGPYQVELQALIDFLNGMTLQDEQRLLKLVKTGPWKKSPADIRYLVLRLVSTRIVTLREKAELEPFDDALPGQPLTTYQLIRNEMRQ
jgi:hypothetical protein